MPYKTIRDVCSITGTTENALRYYDEKNILKPTVKSSSGRHEWLYDDESIKKLEMVMLYRSIDVPVDEIRIAMAEPGGVMHGMLEKRLVELKDKRALIERQITTTEVLLLIESVDKDSFSDNDKQMLLDELIKISKEEA